MANVNRQNNKPGFSLVEVITVLLVVSIGMAGVLNLIIQSVQSQQINKHTLTAYQLAQEGIELVRSRRDNNWVGGFNWNESLDSGAYFMDYTSPEPQPTSAYPNQIAAGRLALDSEGFYSSSPSGFLPDGQYSRIISLVNSVDDGEKLKVRVSIYWYDRGQLNSYSLEADLYNWYATNNP